MKMQEMCDLLGVSAQVIRLYEKYGAIHSFKLEENGYRYYYFEDVGPAIYTRTLRKMGVPLPEAARLVNGTTLEQLKQVMDENAAEVERTIRREQAILEHCRQMKQVAAYCETHLHQYGKCTRPPLWFLPCEQEGKLRQDKAGRALLRRWSECYPFVRYCPMTPKEGLGPQTVSRIGLCVFDEDREFVDGVEDSLVERLAPIKCVGGVTCVSDETTDYYSVVSRGLDYMREHGVSLTGDIYSVLLAAGIKRQDRVYDYHYVWYPVE